MASKNQKEFGFPKQARLRKSVEFERVYSGNVYAADATLVVQGLPNQQERCRLGVSVSRKFGNAVARNRWKRLIREAFRHVQHEFDFTLDLVVRPRKGAEPDYQSVLRSLVKLTKKIQSRISSGGIKPK